MLLNSTIHTFRGGLLENKCIRPSLFIITFLFCLLSCNNLEQGPDTFLPISQTKYVTVTGKILPADGAMPASRSAFASLPAGITYHISASASIGGSTVTLPASDAVIDTSTMTYTLTNIPVSSTETDWTVDIWVNDSSNNKILGASKTLPLTDQNPVYNYDFILKPNYASGNGKIGLEMTVDSSVKRVTASCTASGWTSASPSVNLSSTTVTITSNAIATGSYSVQFDFWDNTTGGTLLYSDTQSINVISFMETDTWVYTGGSGPIKTDGTYELTTALINDFISTTFYVGDTVYGTPASTNTGTAFSPLETIEQAGAIIAARNKASTNYTIIVYGTLTGPQSLPATLDGKAASVAIKGYGTNATLNGNSSGSTLSIKTTVPVIISDLTLTGGTGTASINNYVSPPTTTYYGGGLNLGYQATVSLNNVVIKGNSADYGGGISANRSTLFIYGNTIIGDPDITRPTNASSASNSATKLGGGIYNNSGKLYLGYSSNNNDSSFTPNQESAFTGGIYGNYAAVQGGGIWSGYNSDTPYTYMSSGTISKNFANTSGGGLYINSSPNHICGGTISNNAADVKGGAICIYNTSTLKLGGNVYIPYGGSEKANDINLEKNTTIPQITITDNLSRHTNSDQIAITLYDDAWIRGTTILKEGAFVSGNYEKFKVSDPEWNILLLGTGDSSYGVVDADIYVAGTGALQCTGSPSDSDTVARGTKAKPYKTLAKAAAQCWSTERPFTIYVDGKLSGAQTITDPDGGAIAAQSITVTGYTGSGTDKLDGGFSDDGNKGKTVTIKTGVSVTFTKLGITGGCYPYVTGGADGCGGGMYIDTGSTVTLASDTKIYGNSAGYGAGIYNKGTLILKDNSIIGDLTSRTQPASSTGGSNRASIHGGGIYTSGTVWIGYTQAAATSPDTSFSGGIGYNSAGNSGGGIYIGTSGTVYMSKGQISYNSSNGGSADEGGGGVYIASTNTTNLGLFHMNGGAMNKNWHRGSNGGGGAVYIAGHTKMTMSGDAQITYEGLKKSDVYSARATYWSGHIEVTGALSNTAVATIVPSGLEAGRKLVTLDTDQTDWDTITPKFLLQSTETSIAYYGLDEGCLWPNMDNWGTGMATNFANSSGTLLTASNGTETEIMHSVIDATVVIVDSSNKTLVLNISRIQDDMSGKVYKLKFKMGAQPVVTKYFTFADIDFISQENMYYNISGDELGSNGTAVIGITNLNGNTSNPIISLYAEPRTSKYLVLPTMYD